MTNEAGAVETSASRLARTVEILRAKGSEEVTIEADNLANFLEVCEAARAVVAEVEEAPNPSVHIGTVDYLTGLPIAALAAALENLEGTE